MHRRGLLQVVHDLLDRGALPGCERERQHRRRRFPHPVVHRDAVRLGLDAGRVAMPGVAELVEEELLEDQPALRRRAEGVQILDPLLTRREMRALECQAPVHEAAARAHLRRQQIRQLVRQVVQHLPDQPALHVRRHGAGPLVERHDAADVQCRQVAAHQLELGVQEVQAAGVELDVAENHHRRARGDHIGEVRLVHPRTTNGAAGVADDRVEDLEATAAGHRQLGALDLAHHRSALAGPQRRDRLHPGPVLVAEREPVKQIFDRDQPCAAKVAGPPRADAFQELERRREVVGPGGWWPTGQRPSARGRRRCVGYWREGRRHRPGGSRRAAPARSRSTTAAPGGSTSVPGMPDTSADCTSKRPMPSRVRNVPVTVTGTRPKR